MAKPVNNPCTSKDGVEKKRWATENAALFVARMDRRKDGKKRWVYLCPECLKWHTTTTPPRKDRTPAATLDT